MDHRIYERSDVAHGRFHYIDQCHFAILIGAAYWFGGANGDPEILINLLFYIIITPVLTVTLGKIMYGGENQMIVEDALKRTDGILNRKPLPEATTKQEIPEYSVALQNVSFRYENAERDALHQINLDIKEGEHVAFVGPSGGGKTTLASLIARFYDVTEGKISIGGVDVKDIPSRQLMDMVSFVFQDSKLLKMSIYDNVRMGKKNATREEVMEALKMPSVRTLLQSCRTVWIPSSEARVLMYPEVRHSACPLRERC